MSRTFLKQSPTPILDRRTSVNKNAVILVGGDEAISLCNSSQTGKKNPIQTAGLLPRKQDFEVALDQNFKTFENFSQNEKEKMNRKQQSQLGFVPGIT